MDKKSLNQVMRDMFQSLINDGYKKNQICGCTSGYAYNSQFESFMSGKDLGVVPLARLVDGLGFELRIVPIKKGNAEDIQAVDQICDKFVQDSKVDLVNHLENRTVTPRVPGNGKVEKAINITVEQLLSDINE